MAQSDVADVLQSSHLPARSPAYPPACLWCVQDDDEDSEEEGGEDEAMSEDEYKP